jgi:hypothetical protein
MPSSQGRLGTCLHTKGSKAKWSRSWGRERVRGGESGRSTSTCAEKTQGWRKDGLWRANRDKKSFCARRKGRPPPPFFCMRQWLARRASLPPPSPVGRLFQHSGVSNEEGGRAFVSFPSANSQVMLPRAPRPFWLLTGAGCRQSSFGSFEAVRPVSVGGNGRPAGFWAKGRWKDRWGTE